MFLQVVNDAAQFVDYRKGRKVLNVTKVLNPEGKRPSWREVVEKGCLFGIHVNVVQHWLFSSYRSEPACNGFYLIIGGETSQTGS
jgi:hypothetical protein